MEELRTEFDEFIKGWQEKGYSYDTLYAWMRNKISEYDNNRVKSPAKSATCGNFMDAIQIIQGLPENALHDITLYCMTKDKATNEQLDRILGKMEKTEEIMIAQTAVLDLLKSKSSV